MAYTVLVKGKYYELRESYRDERGRPRSRLLKYLGRRSDDPQARLAQMLDTAERKAEQIASEQRERFGETAEERAERLASEARFSQEGFLEETTNPVPSEQSPPAPSPSDEPDTQDTSPEAPSE